MTKEELDKKIKSFSENSGLGKTYNYYELSDTSKENYSQETLAVALPDKVLIKISSVIKNSLILLCTIIVLVVFAVRAFEVTFQSGIWSAIWLIAIGFVVLLVGLELISRNDKTHRLQIIMTEEHIAFNKDVFKWVDIENTFLKRDFNKVKKQLALWQIVLLKNGDLYYYDLKKFNSSKKVVSGLTLQELFFLYRKHSAPNKNLAMKSFGN